MFWTSPTASAIGRPGHTKEEEAMLPPLFALLPKSVFMRRIPKIDTIRIILCGAALYVLITLVI
jgi:hypothetical protein